MRWTNDCTYQHLIVVNPVGRERYSVAFFLTRIPDAVVEVFADLYNGGFTAKYPSTTGADYLKQRLDATYSHREKA